MKVETHEVKVRRGDELVTVAVFIYASPPPHRYPRIKRRRHVSTALDNTITVSMHASVDTRALIDDFKLLRALGTV